jgi:hypothetical protein
MNPYIKNFALFTQPIDQIYENHEEILNLSYDLTSHIENFYIQDEGLDLKEYSKKKFPVKSDAKKKGKHKRLAKFRFKYILQPKWEETISKMKTHWFISAKSRIISSFNLLAEISAKFVGFVEIMQIEKKQQEINSQVE